MGAKNEAYNEWLKAQKRGYEGDFDSYYESYESYSMAGEKQLDQDYTTWDAIASDIYGDPRMAQALMASNPGLNTFTQGTTINAPPKYNDPYVSHDWMADQRGQTAYGMPTNEYWASQPVVKTYQAALASGDKNAIDTASGYLPNKYRDYLTGGGGGVGQVPASGADPTQPLSSITSGGYQSLPAGYQLPGALGPTQGIQGYGGVGPASTNTIQGLQGDPRYSSTGIVPGPPAFLPNQPPPPRTTTFPGTGAGAYTPTPPPAPATGGLQSYVEPGPRSLLDTSQATLQDQTQALDVQYNNLVTSYPGLASTDPAQKLAAMYQMTPQEIYLLELYNNYKQGGLR